MNGSLGFNSELGCGSTFWAELEFAVPKGGASTFTETGESVLLVSDSELQTQALLNAGNLVGRQLITTDSLDEARKLMVSTPGGRWRCAGLPQATN